MGARPASEGRFKQASTEKSAPSVSGPAAADVGPSRAGQGSPSHTCQKLMKSSKWRGLKEHSVQQKMAAQKAQWVSGKHNNDKSLAGPSKIDCFEEAWRHVLGAPRTRPQPAGGTPPLGSRPCSRRHLERAPGAASVQTKDKRS